MSIIRRFIALLMAFTLCAALAGCTKKPAENPNTIEGTNGLEGTNGSENMPTETEPDLMLLDVGEETSLDLDSDGEKETLLVEIVTDPEGWQHYTVSINGSDLMEPLGLYFDYPDTERYSVVDLDTADSFLEIALADNGPSNDPNTTFLRYENGTLTSLGQVYGKVTEEDLVFRGDGTIASTMRLSVLQTWYTPVDWQIGQSGAFEPIAQELYYPIQTEDTPVKTAVKELAAYEEMSLDSARSSAAIGTEMTFLATDNKEWVHCEDASGTRFWIHLDESGQQVELVDGSYAWDGIEGLSIAD